MTLITLDQPPNYGACISMTSPSTFEIALSDEEEEEEEEVTASPPRRRIFTPWLLLVTLLFVVTTFAFLVATPDDLDINTTLLSFFGNNHGNSQEDPLVDIDTIKEEPFAISIWLIPPQNIRDGIQPFIDEFSQLQVNASAPFLPHITITGGVDVHSQHELELVSKTLETTLLAQDEIATGIDCDFETYPQTNVDPQGKVIWSQALILKMKVSDSYQHACHTSRHVLGLPEDPTACRNPHMSLLYTNEFPDAEVHDLALQELELPLQFTATRIAVYTTEPSSVEGVRYWKLYSEFSLGMHEDDDLQ